MSLLKLVRCSVKTNMAWPVVYFSHLHLHHSADMSTDQDTVGFMINR